MSQDKVRAAHSEAQWGMKSLNQRHQLPVTGCRDRPVRLSVGDYIQTLTDYFLCEFLTKEKKEWHHSLSFPCFIHHQKPFPVVIFTRLICRGNDTYCSLKENCRVSPTRTVCTTRQHCFKKDEILKLHFLTSFLFILLSLVVLFSALQTLTYSSWISLEPLCRVAL